MTSRKTVRVWLHELRQRRLETLREHEAVGRLARRLGARDVRRVVPLVRSEIRGELHALHLSRRVLGTLVGGKGLRRHEREVHG